MVRKNGTVSVDSDRQGYLNMGSHPTSSDNGSQFRHCEQVLLNFTKRVPTFVLRVHERIINSGKEKKANCFCRWGEKKIIVRGADMSLFDENTRTHIHKRRVQSTRLLSRYNKKKSNNP